MTLAYHAAAGADQPCGPLPSRRETTHLTAAELAQLALPGLPTTKSAVIRRAKAEGWSSIPRLGRGGGRLYAVAELPAAVRDALNARQSARPVANSRAVGRPKGSDFFTRNPDVADAVEAIITQRDLSDPAILELLAQRFAALPSRRTLQRFRRALEDRKCAVIASLRDPDAYKNQYKLALGRADGALTHANQRWEIDTTKADVLTIGGRVCVLGLIDVWSRRARFLVVPSESAQSVRRLLVTTIRAWGVMPEEVGTDNGSGFVNASLGSALDALGIRQWRCAPGTPEKKPYVERLFGTFTRERAELLDGYAGHNVAEAQQLRGRARKETGRAVIVPTLTPEALQAILDGWTEGVYNQRPHSTTKQPPLVRFLSSPTPSAAAPGEDALRIALSRSEGSATVGKRGVQWKSGRYWAAALVPYVGRQVRIRRDEDDLGALFVFDADGRFIDTAVNHERAGLSESAFAQAAARQQAEFMSAARAEVREKQRRFKYEDMRDAVLRADAEAAGKLVSLPVPTVARSTPQLDSIAAAPTPIVPDASALDAAVARTAGRRPAPTAPIADRVADADRILAAAARGEAVDPAALDRARLFATSSDYRAEKMLTGDFRRPAAPHHHPRSLTA